MRAMRLIRAVALGFLGLAGLTACGAQAAQTPGRWAQPAADLAGQIADILGPGQAQLTIRNLSTIQATEIPAIRKLLEQDLKSRGIVVSGGEGAANAVRVTLSENARERLWVAEVMEGSEVRNAMVHVDASTPVVLVADARMVLRKEKVAGLFNRIGGVVRDNPILAAAEVNGHFVVMYADRISIFSAVQGTWAESNTFVMEKKLSRDPRGVLLANADGGSFTAYAPGAECVGRYSLPLGGSTSDSGWNVRCGASDDPWPMYQSGDASSAPALKAFYNPARDFFTGVVIPSIGVDLPAFYTAGIIPRAAGGAGLLIAGIDGRVSLVENGVVGSIGGTRDWGSDFAMMRSGCGGGTQIVATSSGQATSDSLRAFEIPALDVVPASAPLAMDGTVTALWTAQDGKSLLVAVRNPAGEYEVDRVTALCN
jgi:hypothetical protein